MIAYIGRHWRGELSLWVSWWINCVALSALLWFLIPWLAVAGNFAVPDTLGRYGAAFALQFLEIALVPLWQMVGLWRSGGRQAATTDRWLTGRATQVTAFLFTTLITMRGLVFGAEAVIGVRVALALGPYRYTVSLRHSGREILLRGGLGYGASAAVQSVLAAHPRVRRIQLESGGGALSEGTRLREVIISHGLDTYTADECSSACVSAYAGGRRRYLQRGARLGFHLPRNWDALSTSAVPWAYRSELAYFSQLGVPNWFLARWVQTGRKFWYPTELQLVRSGFVTNLRGAPPPATRRQTR
ncbi:MAG: hypothetical protein ABI661_12905 [Gammaproteobacteria bacterium]